MGTHSDRLMSLLLSLYISIMGLPSLVASWYLGLGRRMSRRMATQSGGFFSENFLYLAVFSIPVAFLFYLLARKYIWPYAQDNIFPCFDGNGGDCFGNFDGSSFPDSSR